VVGGFIASAGAGVQKLENSVEAVSDSYAKLVTSFNSNPAWIKKATSCVLFGLLANFQDALYAAVRVVERNDAAAKRAASGGAKPGAAGRGGKRIFGGRGGGAGGMDMGSLITSIKLGQTGLKKKHPAGGGGRGRGASPPGSGPPMMMAGIGPGMLKKRSGAGASGGKPPAAAAPPKQQMDFRSMLKKRTDD
jgi:hypothetical protein